MIEPPSSFAPLEVAFLVESQLVSRYVYDLAEWARDHPKINISYVLIQGDSGSEPGPASKRLYDVFNERAFGVLRDIEDIILEKRLRSKEHREMLDIAAVASNEINLRARAAGNSAPIYSNEDIAKIGRLDLDLLIQFSPCAINGRLWSAARLGVLSLDCGASAGSGAAGFWETLEGRESSVFTIRHQAGEGDAKVLIRGALAAKPLFRWNRINLSKKGAFFLKNLLRQAADTGALPPAAEQEPQLAEHVHRTPSLHKQIAYVMGTFARVANDALRKKRYRWGVAFQRKPWTKLVMCEAYRIEPPQGHFLADPFIVKEGDRDYCFVEDWCFKKGKASISVYELKEDRAERLGDAIVEPFHLSYPYPFRVGGKLFICPESRNSGDIRVYECEEFPLRWKLSKVLMSDIQAVNSTIFEHDGLWWLLTNVDSAGGGDCGSELHIFHSTHPLNGAWTPHPANPVYIDAAKARNGGFIADSQGLFRISQMRGFDLYGKGFAINQIAVLNTNEYKEHRICAVKPNSSSGIIGMHHFHSNGEICVFDYL